MITWDAYPPAPCQGQILSDDDRSILVQTDWDYPGVATTFGWDKTMIQCCESCGHTITRGEGDYFSCDVCDKNTDYCNHDATDGTVDCSCGLTASDFIGDASDWLDDNDGATADDPGYFE